MTEPRPTIRFALAAYVVGLVFATVTLVTCSRSCQAAPITTEVGLRAALERLP